jgi:hypothetical protein
MAGTLPQGQRLAFKLAEILDKLLKVLVKERYQSVDEVLQDLHSPETLETIVILRFLTLLLLVIPLNLN